MRGCFLGALICLLAATPASVLADSERELPLVYQDFLEDTRYLLLKRERKAFLALEKDHQRDAFIEDFWAARDPYPHTARNEFRIRWEGRLELARERYGDLDDERSPALLLAGEPSRQLTTDCHGRLALLDVWYYERGASERGGSSFFLIFVRRSPRDRARLWRPASGLAVLFVNPPPSLRIINEIRADEQLWTALQEITRHCGEHDKQSVLLRQALLSIFRQHGPMGYFALLASLLAPPPAQEGNWLQEFRTTTTDLSERAQPWNAELSWHPAGADGAWTLMDGRVLVEGEPLRPSPARPVQVDLFGEIFREERLYESFRYRFELEESELGVGSIPLVVQRRLRPGDYEAVIRVVEAGSAREARLTGSFSVPPSVSEGDPALEDETPDPPTFRLVPPEGESQTGSVRIQVEHDLEGVARVRFLLDGRPILTKTRPPFGVAIDLGSLPVPHRVEAEALDAQGLRLAADLLELNPEPHRLSIQLAGEILEDSRGRRLEIVSAVSVPAGERLDRLELFREERRIATLFQAPWTASVPLSGKESPAWVRAAAYLEGGKWTERIAFLDGTLLRDHVDVQFVELFATVLDRGQRPVGDLDRADFTVLESGREQRLARFERVEDLPIHVALLLDGSASMEPRLPTARQAAVGFLERVLRPGDRAAVTSFSHRPRQHVDFTDDVSELHGALGELRAQGETALHDAVVFSLRAFGGLQGQRALLLLSDGGDRASRYSFEEALEFARRSGVAIYAVGLDVGLADQVARSRLRRLSAETGGMSFLVEDASGLEAIYRQIEEDLRSRYLLAYQSTATTGPEVFRPVEVRVRGDGLTVRTSTGYFP